MKIQLINSMIVYSWKLYPQMTISLVYYICLICCSTDVHLPEQLQRAMAAEAEATREARAKVRAKVEELHMKFVVQFIIGVAPITQLRTCVIKIVSFKRSHLMCQSDFPYQILRNCS